MRNILHNHSNTAEVPGGTGYLTKYGRPSDWKREKVGLTGLTGLTGLLIFPSNKT